MRKADPLESATSGTMTFDGRTVEYHIVHSTAARKLRIRVGPKGVEVVQPAQRAAGELEAFLAANEQWIIGQLERIERLRAVRVPQRLGTGAILYRGVETPVRVEDIARRQRSNQVVLDEDSIVIVRGRTSQTAPAKSLENWLRRQARVEVTGYLDDVTGRLNHFPRRVYLMDQRTKWGNCSRRGNLSFNWRLIMAPVGVLRYIVTHEVVHLAIPDHSRRFWLTVHSLCRDTERARQWLSANAHNLRVDLREVCSV